MAAAAPRRKRGRPSVLALLAAEGFGAASGPAAPAAAPAAAAQPAAPAVADAAAAADGLGDAVVLAAKLRAASAALSRPLRPAPQQHPLAEVVLLSAAAAVASCSEHAARFWRSSPWTTSSMAAAADAFGSSARHLRDVGRRLASGGDLVERALHVRLHVLYTITTYTYYNYNSWKH